MTLPQTMREIDVQTALRAVCSLYGNDRGLQQSPGDVESAEKPRIVPQQVVKHRSSVCSEHCPNANTPCTVAQPEGPSLPLSKASGPPGQSLGTSGFIGKGGGYWQVHKLGNPRMRRVGSYIGTSGERHRDIVRVLGRSMTEWNNPECAAGVYGMCQEV